MAEANNQMQHLVVALAPGQPRYRILVVDDRREARQLLVRLLTPLGFDVREAANGQEAVDSWNAWQPHLIWMDMRMPVLDGRAATRRIKASPNGQATAIIALTASSFEEERADILAAGCDDLLCKPFQEADLFALMQKHLGVRFVYQDDPAAALQSSVPVDVAALAALPAALRSTLEQALIQLDTVTVMNAIGEVPDVPLAHALEMMANEFQYNRMLHLIQDVDRKEQT
jgi:CheY-like chemotaxis protein